MTVITLPFPSFKLVTYKTHKQGHKPKGNNKIIANNQFEKSINQGKKEMMRSDRKPPLARSPIRLRSRRALQSDPKILQNLSSASKITNTQLPKRAWDTEEQNLLRPEYATISCEIRALARMVQGEFKENETGNSWNTNQTPLFERGRFYEEYSAKRNERLKRKKGHLIGDEKKYDLGVRVESAKKEIKKCVSLRKVVPATPLTEKRKNSRYSLRSSSLKENKKPPLPMAVSYDKSVGGTGKKIGARRIGKI